MKRINIFSVKQVKESSGLYNLDHTKINSPECAYNVVQTVLNIAEEAVEKFGIITLNTKNGIAGVHIISVGSLSAAVVHPREVLKAAILNNAASFVCFHNHPSGDPTPSPQDVEITRRLIEAGDLLGIECLDHIVIGDDCFISMKEQGLI